jgi:aspartyl-tRNA(Asn)/glutamyl-tRNA(Gln) amidotransferase subunit B
MEEGSFRCDANISIRPEGSQESTAKVEVKNMNSFRAVYGAMEYEARRQRKAVEEGKRLIQETRGWVEEKGTTVSQRSKEYAHDYRYFPEPDLPPLVISQEWVEQIKSKLPELPEARRDRFIADYGLPLYDANLLTASKEMADYFEDSTRSAEYKNLPPDKAAKETSNWLLGEVSHILNTNNVDITDFAKKVSPGRLVGLLVLESQRVVNAPVAKSVLGEMYATSKEAADIIQEKGLGQISDTGEVEEIITQVIKDNPQPVADFRKGKEQALKFLVGQVMKATRGRANPQMANELLKKKLGEE